MEENEDFQPLRKSLKRKETENEDNFVLSYRNDIQAAGEPKTRPADSPISPSEIEKLRFHNSIEVDDENCAAPITTFKQANLPSEILKYLSTLLIHSPTPVQMQAIPILLSGRDVVVIAPTGSGKTLSYLLPLYTFLERKYKRIHSNPGAPVALILTPTRELMQQVLETAINMLDTVKNTLSNFPQSQAHVNSFPGYPRHFSPAFLPNNFQHPLQPQIPPAHASASYSSFLPQYSQSHYSQQYWNQNNDQSYFEPSYSIYGVCGGIPFKTHVERLKQHIDIVVATPGRLLELSQKNIIDLSGISFLVIDECDKMLDMGLEEQLRKLISLITVCDIPRQTSLWSATLPDSLERLARSAVLNPVIMHVGLKDTVCKNIQQDIIFMHSYQKPKRLLQTLRTIQYPPVIVFASSITVVDEIVELLKEEEFHVEGLHSQKDQEQRFRILSGFRNGTFDVLVATDLASRGLDIVDITHVINYDTPNSIQDYIHRCGRTGRFGRPGYATTFLTLDCKIANELKELLESSGLLVPMCLIDTKQFGKKILKTEFGDRVI